MICIGDCRTNDETGDGYHGPQSDTKVDSVGVSDQGCLDSEEERNSPIDDGDQHRLSQHTGKAKVLAKFEEGFDYEGLSDVVKVNSGHEEDNCDTEDEQVEVLVYPTVVEVCKVYQVVLALAESSRD